jgi:xanthine/CO dehydrogenase XdhC/CoxF family maturation factor
MNELHSILDGWREAASAGQDAVLATVVHVEGSAYRRPGARMLILPDGRRIGSISGGCLESDLAGKCWWMTDSGNPTVRVYDTTSDDDAVWEFGLGCNGVVHVLLERVTTTTSRHTREFLERWRSSRTAAAIAIVVRAASDSPFLTGDRLFCDGYRMAGGNLQGTRLEQEAACHARGVIAARRSCLIHLKGAELFVEYLAPPMPLVIFGAGHDAVPVANMAKQMGWHVTVADGRPAYARACRFPVVDRVVLMSSRDLLAGIDIGPETVVVMMTHNFPQDSRLLPMILAKGPRYIGLLGPRKRATKLFDEMGCDLNDVPAVHAPVGLDVGADTPEGIAVSIIAEIQAAISGRSGAMLRHRPGPIHTPVEELGRRSHAIETIPELAVCGISL